MTYVRFQLAIKADGFCVRVFDSRNVHIPPIGEGRTVAEALKDIGVYVVDDERNTIDLRWGNYGGYVSSVKPSATVKMAVLYCLSLETNVDLDLVDDMISRIWGI